MVNDGLRRVRAMITEAGLSDLMPTERLNRVEEETRERRVRADAAEIEPDDRGNTEPASAREMTSGGQYTDNGPALSGRMRQFAETVPEVFRKGVIETAGLNLHPSEGEPDTAEVEIQAGDSEPDSDAVAAVRHEHQRPVRGVGLRDGRKVGSDEGPGLDSRIRRRREMVPEMPGDSEAVRDERLPAAAPSPIADRAAPEISVDVSVDGVAGRSRRWLKMDDDQVIVDMIGRREAMVERGR